MSSLAPPMQPQPIDITELLALILSFLDNRSLVRAALVSQQWAEAALDILWQHMNDIRPLLSLLAPLAAERRTTAHGTVSFVRFRRRLQAADWQKWDRYARRVRTLDIDDRRSITRRTRLEPSVYDEIARTSPRVDLLPNLQSFSWWTVSAERQRRSLLFMHDNISSLSLQFAPSSTQPLPAYVDEVVARCPHLTKLEVRSDAAMRDIQLDVLSLVHRLPQLRSLVVPMYFVTSDAMAELSRVPHLESIEFAHPVEGGTGDRADVVDFTPLIPDGAFPSLKILSFSAHLQHAANFLALPAAPKKLCELYLQVLAIDNPPMLQHFFSIVSERFTCLTELHIDFLLGPDTPVVSPPPPQAARPSLETIRPLMACHCFRVIELRWDYQLNVTEEDLEVVAPSWPLLETLVLNCDPIPEPDPPILTARALFPFARHCLKLRELSIYIDGNRLPAQSTFAVHPFRALERLALGSSPIRSVDPMALFLSQLLPVNCQIVAGVRWPDAYGIALDHAGVTDDSREEMSEWWVRWTNVGKVLPLTVKARQDEKERVAAHLQAVDRLNMDRVIELENEVRELRSRMEFGP